jgi:hypothetical protein
VALVTLVRLCIIISLQSLQLVWSRLSICKRWCTLLLLAILANIHELYSWYCLLTKFII